MLAAALTNTVIPHTLRKRLLCDAALPTHPTNVSSIPPPPIDSRGARQMRPSAHPPPSRTTAAPPDSPALKPGAGPTTLHPHRPTGANEWRPRDRKIVASRHDLRSDPPSPLRAPPTSPRAATARKNVASPPFSPAQRPLRRPPTFPTRQSALLASATRDGRGPFGTRIMILCAQDAVCLHTHHKDGPGSAPSSGGCTRLPGDTSLSADLSHFL